MCCVYSLESPHRDDSNKYTQHTIIVQTDQIFLNYHHLLPDLAPLLTLCGSNYPYFEIVSTVLKMSQPLEFDWIFKLEWIVIIISETYPENATVTKHSPPEVPQEEEMRNK